MTRQQFVIKWTVYLLALLPIWFVEAVLLRRIPVFGVVPMLLPLSAVAVATLEGSVAGAGFGLAVGVLCDAAYFGTGGTMTIGLALMGAAAGMVTQYWLRQNFWGFFVCSAGSLLVIDAFRVLRRLLMGMAPLVPLLRVAAPEIFWSLVFSPLVYWIIRSAYQRVGGTVLM